MIRRFLVAVLFGGLVWTFASAAARAAEIEIQRDVEYSNPGDAHLKLTLARPKEIEGRAPAVVCIHGGGWVAGNRDAWEGMCGHLARRGYVAVTVTYRFAPQHPFPAAVNDVKAAVRWLRANAERLQVDPNRIGALGDSAGGHLSQMLGVTGTVKEFDADGDNLDQSSRIQCVVNFYGPVDLVRAYGFHAGADDVFRKFMGGDLEHERHRHVMGSPLSWVTPDSAPTLIIHGTKDPVVSYDQAILLRDRLQAADVDNQLLTLEGAGHGFNGADLDRAQEATFAFFDKHLKNTVKESTAK